jgi:CheY-like chemotaxis protein
MYSREALSSREGCRRAGKYPNLLLDINMPGLTGRELLERYAQANLIPHADMLVVMLSSSRSPIDRELSAKNGAGAYLEKPLTLEKFAGVLTPHPPAA